MSDMLYTQFVIEAIPGAMNWIATSDVEFYRRQLEEDLPEAAVDTTTLDNGRDIESITVTLPYPKSRIPAPVRRDISQIGKLVLVDISTVEKAMPPEGYENRFDCSLEGLQLTDSATGRTSRYP